MEKNELYLIKRETLIRHMDDKARLYAMLQMLSDIVEKLPESPDSEEQREMVRLFRIDADSMHTRWDIPMRYLFSGNEDELEPLLREQLSDPYEEGFVRCEDCEGFDDEDDLDDYVYDAEDEDDTDHAACMVSGLLELLRDLLGDHITIHIDAE